MGGLRHGIRRPLDGHRHADDLLQPGQRLGWCHDLNRVSSHDGRDLDGPPFLDVDRLLEAALERFKEGELPVPKASEVADHPTQGLAAAFHPQQFVDEELGRRNEEPSTFSRHAGRPAQLVKRQRRTILEKLAQRTDRVRSHPGQVDGRAGFQGELLGRAALDVGDEAFGEPRRQVQRGVGAAGVAEIYQQHLGDERDEPVAVHLKRQLDGVVPALGHAVPDDGNLVTLLRRYAEVDATRSHHGNSRAGKASPAVPLAERLQQRGLHTFG